MDQSVRAVYQCGYLRLLGPVDLSEGQEVEIVILPPYDEAADNLPLFDVLFGDEDDESEGAEEDGMSIPVTYPPADERPLQVRSPQANNQIPRLPPDRDRFFVATG